MNKSTVNIPRSQLETQQSKAKKRKLIKEIVTRETKRIKEKKSLLKPTSESLSYHWTFPRQHELGFLKVTTSSKPATTHTLTASPRKISTGRHWLTSVLKNQNSPKRPDPRTKPSPPKNIAATKAALSPGKLFASNSDSFDHPAKVTESQSKSEGKSKGAKKEPTLTRKKMTKEEAEMKKQEHREMVRGLFGKLDFLVGGGLG